MNTTFRGKNLITCEEWTKDELETVFEAAKYLKMKYALNEKTELLKDKTAFLMFLNKAQEQEIPWKQE